MTDPTERPLPTFERDERRWRLILLDADVELSSSVGSAGLTRNCCLPDLCAVVRALPEEQQLRVAIEVQPAVAALMDAHNDMTIAAAAKEAQATRLESELAKARADRDAILAELREDLLAGDPRAPEETEESADV